MRQSEILKKFSRLTDSQKEQIRREVDDYLAINASLQEEVPQECPKCHGQYKMISHGRQKNNGKRRYICSGCGRAIT